MCVVGYNPLVLIMVHYTIYVVTCDRIDQNYNCYLDLRIASKWLHLIKYIMSCWLRNLPINYSSILFVL